MYFVFGILRLGADDVFDKSILNTNFKSILYLNTFKQVFVTTLF